MATTKKGKRGPKAGSSYISDPLKKIDAGEKWTKNLHFTGDNRDLVEKILEDAKKSPSIELAIIGKLRKAYRLKSL